MIKRINPKDVLMGFGIGVILGFVAIGIIMIFFAL